MNEIIKAYEQGFIDRLQEFAKIAARHKKMPHFTEQDRAAKAKEIYRALSRPSAVKELKKRYGSRWEEVKARIAESLGD